MLGNSFYMQIQQKNIKEDHFDFPKHSISFFERSVDTIEKLEPIEKITLYLIKNTSEVTYTHTHIFTKIS